MTAILYYLFIWPVSILPFRMLYFFSDMLYLVLYKLAGYRKKVVTENLINSFPDKSSNEIERIRKAFYHHLCDLIVESLKLFTLPEKKAKKHLVVSGTPVTDKYFEQGKDILMMAGHNANWEYAAISPIYLKNGMAVAYTPIKNRFFDKKMKSSRSRFGFTLFSVLDTKRFLMQKKDKPTIVIFISDQSPRKESISYWTHFLNQETAWLTGAERYARELNMPVVFCGVRKIKRGYYEMFFEELVENPLETSEGEITQRYVERLEKLILEKPEHWLWSHKRWKRKKPEGLKLPGMVNPKKK